MDTVRKFLVAFQKGVDWFRDRRNRDEAIKILVTTGNLKPDDVAKSYDFFRDGEFFEPSGVVSKAKLRTVVGVLGSLGDLPGDLDIDSLILPGVTRVSD
jgi:ABC-type nitrate/sulfonate/bicarbonate transport system substrate-binding protein